MATIVAEFGDCRRKRRLSPFSAKVAVYGENGDCRHRFGDKLSPKSATIVSSVDML